MYRALDPDEIIATMRRLRERITERFPDSGLSKVAGAVLELARQSVPRIESIRRPNIPLRLGVFLLVGGVVGILVSFVASHRLMDKDLSSETTKGLVELLEPSLGSTFFIGAAIFFLVSLETRIKRNRALKATHELRVLAHIIDMHQLTKDPERQKLPGPDTSSSPGRSMSLFELSRYLDYCSECLSIISKIGALYAQRITDPIALSAVDQVEILTANLSRKIWQKLMILDQFATADSKQAEVDDDGVTAPDPTREEP